VPVRLVDGTGVLDFLKQCPPEPREPVAVPTASDPA
jgi:hypothetical protein